MATQEEVLQKVNDYCTEKQYTLNDDFRSKFSAKFADAHSDAPVDDENVLSNIKFNLDTAFSAASKELKVKDESWKTKEAEYLKQIEALKKTHDGKKEEPKKVESEVPEDVRKELEELKRYQAEGQKREKRANVLKLAQKNVREDLHENLEDVLNIMQLDYSKDDSELAKELNANFTKIYKGKIGDVRPQLSQSTKRSYDDILKNLPKVNVF
jgi:type VI protein secretion system component VasK